jgi:ethanolamine transporter EutH
MNRDHKYFIFGMLTGIIGMILGEIVGRLI